VRPLHIIATTIVVAAALTLSACSPSTGEEPAATGGGEFPVTVNHAFGETTVEAAPARVATLGWANHEVPLSLGVVPVGMSKATWGDDDGDGVLPWVEEALAELDAETPVLFDETDSVPFEQIADTRPDVILAAYSGITQEDYDKLSKIAPVVAYPDIPWGTSLEEMVELDAAALGMSDEAADLNASLEAEATDALAQFPGLEDTTVLFTSFEASSDYSTIGFYSTRDPRAGFLADVGLDVPEVVKEESAHSEAFWIERSAEDVEAFADVDLIVSYGSDDPAVNAATIEELQADPLLGRIPAIRDGHVAFLGTGPLSAAANPSPLSIPWGVHEYLARLADTLN
jgi:iron complex transport system substrate-binding protein